MPESIESEYFTVVYDEKDNNVIDSILAVIDTTYENITDIFNLKNAARVSPYTSALMLRLSKS